MLAYIYIYTIHGSYGFVNNPHFLGEIVTTTSAEISLTLLFHPCGKCWRCWRVLVKWIQMCEQSVWFPLGPLKCWMKRVVEIYHGYMDGILLETSHNLDGWNIPWMVKESSRNVFPTPGWSPEVFTYYSADGGRIISDAVSMVQLVV